MEAKEKKTKKQSKYAFHIASKIKAYLEEKDISYRKLETMAGVPMNSVYNIINGHAFNPTIETIADIANAMDCSLDALIGKSVPQSSVSVNVIDLDELVKYTWNSELVLDAIETINKLLRDKGIAITLAKGITYLSDIYRYSCKNNNNQLDKNFAEWNIDKL